MSFALGVDIGGTFTDLALVMDGVVHTHKRLTTPENPVHAVLDGVRVLLTQHGNHEHWRLVHGTTLVTNAVVERRGASTGLITTSGFRDVLEIRREGRYDLYDLNIRFPEPLTPRSRRLEARERIDETGAVLTPLDEGELRVQLHALTDPPESWAICFLHAYANPLPEQAAARVVQEVFPDAPVTVSSAVAPELREYERTSTTVANAYVRPVAESYLRRLRSGVDDMAREAGCPPPALAVMQSDGGMIPPETAALEPIRIVESGPAGGVIAAARLGAALGEPAVFSLDMGGTTAKISFLDAEGPRTTTSFEVDRRHLYRKGSGLPLLVPSIDLVEIGAGGGSLAGVGALGTVAVGPRSAGAHPGPACYGQGGIRATVTDADLVLGLLDPAFFLGGQIALDVDQARDAIRRDVAEPLGCDVEAAAHSVFVTVGSEMAEAARVHGAERGVDTTGHLLVAFGGAGPVHAWSVARQLRMSRIVYPSHAGVASALGFLAAAPSYESVRSATEPLPALDTHAADQRLDELEQTARTALGGMTTGLVQVERSVDMRYRGQGSEVRVSCEVPINRARLLEAFTGAYREQYGRAVEDVPVETVTWRVRCRGEVPSVPSLDQAAEVATSRVPTQHGSRRAWLPDTDAPRDTPVYRRDALQPGDAIQGPALIEEAQSTLVVGRGTARVLTGGHVLAEPEPLS